MLLDPTRRDFRRDTLHSADGSDKEKRLQDGGHSIRNDPRFTSQRYHTPGEATNQPLNGDGEKPTRAVTAPGLLNIDQVWVRSSVFKPCVRFAVAMPIGW